MRARITCRPQAILLYKKFTKCQEKLFNPLFFSKKLPFFHRMCYTCSRIPQDKGEPPS
jgi:hypothetical protein